MILLIASEKGGTNKTTLATNLAVWLAHEGRDVVLLDTDKQPSTSRWVDRRNAAKITPQVHITSKLGNVYETARDLATRYQQVIIDAGGRDSEEMRTAMAAADVLYIPTKASQLDLETLVHVQSILTGAKAFNPTLQSRIIISEAPTNPSIRDVLEAKEAIAKEISIEISNSVICYRKVYRDAVAEGKGVVEMDNPKAKAEIQLLGQEIYQ